MTRDGDASFGEPPMISILTLAKELEFRGVPKSREFAEMIGAAASGDPSAIAPTRQAVDVVNRDATPAEDAAAKVVALVAGFAHHSNLDDDALGTLVLLATHFALRFEEYLAERSAGDPF